MRLNAIVHTFRVQFHFAQHAQIPFANDQIVVCEGENQQKHTQIRIVYAKTLFWQFCHGMSALSKVEHCGCGVTWRKSYVLLNNTTYIHLKYRPIYVHIIYALVREEFQVFTKDFNSIGVSKKWDEEL